MKMSPIQRRLEKHFSAFPSQFHLSMERSRPGYSQANLIHCYIYAERMRARN